MQSMLNDVHTMQVGKVTEYDEKTHKCSVQPLVQRRVRVSDEEETAETLPIIPNVPVWTPRTRKFFLIIPLEPGDIVTLIFAERSLDTFLSSNGVTPVDPIDFTTHELKDAIAFPGGYPFTVPVQNVPSGEMAMGRDGNGIQIRFSDDELKITLAGNSSKRVVLAEDLEALWNQDKAWKQTHSHPANGSPPSQQPSPPWDANIASNVVSLPENK